MDTVSFSTTSEIMNFQSRQIMLRSKIINQEEVTLFDNEKTNTPTPWLTQIFKVNFTSMSFQKIPIPHLTLTMKQKFLH